MQFVRRRGERNKQKRDMKKKEAYNEDLANEAEVASGEGKTPQEGASGDNMADAGAAAADTMADSTDAPDEASQAVEAAVAEWKDKYLRLQAEFDNYRKRTLREKMDLVLTGGRDVLLAMLPVRDDVQRALAAMEKSDDIEALRQGVQLISQKFTEALRQKGVTEMELKEKEFDADVAEAVARFAAGEEMKGRVIDVVQTGYMLGDKVLRFAKVVVGE